MMEGDMECIKVLCLLMNRYQKSRFSDVFSVCFYLKGHEWWWI